MEIKLSAFPGFSLQFVGDRGAGDEYSTSRLQKGFLLVDDGVVLAEEAVGFGVPVLKRGLQAVFPGRVEFTWIERGPIHEIVALFKLNLEEKIYRSGSESIKSPGLYRIKNILAALIRQVPWLRSMLTSLSSVFRLLFDWQTAYEEGAFHTQVRMTYSIQKATGTMSVRFDLTDMEMTGVTEIVVMNEQGAHFFTHYQDSNGLRLQGKKIGTWDEVRAPEAAFISPACRIAFKLKRVEGAKLYRGRELVGSRLAWSGFGYSLPPGINTFSYDLILERLP
jgi:hypothetical protein